MVLHFSLTQWVLLIMHEIRAELKVDTECGQWTAEWAKPGLYQLTMRLMSGMLKWGYEARPCDICQPIFWWCDICRSIVGQGMFLSVCLVWLLSLEIWELNACCLWQYYVKGDPSNDMLFLGSGTSSHKPLPKKGKGKGEHYTLMCCCRTFIIIVKAYCCMIPCL